MQGIELTSQGLINLASAFTTYFFPYITNTVVALAPWVVVVAGAIAVARMIKRFIAKTTNAGGGDGGTHIARRRRILDRDIKMMQMDWRTARKRGLF